MIVVIQCAASKRPDAGYLRARRNKPVMFVAHPDIAPASDRFRYARPDDSSDGDQTWRELLLQYNRDPRNNPLGLFAAFELYGNTVYRRLVERFGLEQTYILSAGWGLINASFLAPNYDITFSQAVKRTAPWKHRSKRDRYKDTCMLSNHAAGPIVFFGGKDYVPLFCSLTEASRGDRVVFYNSKNPPDAPGCSLKKYETSTRTNWHYKCANAFIDGQVDLSQ